MKRKFINCFLFFGVIFALWIRIHNTAKYVEFEENFQVFMMYLVIYKCISVATNVVFFHDLVNLIVHYREASRMRLRMQRF
jgi:hypothetical protein